MEEKLIEWLATQGYPLEMRVAKAFTENRFDVIQARYFEDPEEGALREIDLTAAHMEVEDGFFGSVVFTIECKTSSNKPWILFSPVDRESVGYLQNFRGSAIVSESVRRDFGTLGIIGGSDIPSFHHGPRYGYGITQAFTSGIDVPYKAVRGAVKAAVARVRETGDSENIHSPSL